MDFLRRLRIGIMNASKSRIICFASFSDGFCRNTFPSGVSVAIAANCRSGVFRESMFWMVYFEFILYSDVSHFRFCSAPIVACLSLSIP